VGLCVRLRGRGRLRCRCGVEYRNERSILNTLSRAFILTLSTPHSLGGYSDAKQGVSIMSRANAVDVFEEVVDHSI
jgi:hypothetical protein